MNNLRRGVRRVRALHKVLLKKGQERTKSLISQMKVSMNKEIDKPIVKISSPPAQIIRPTGDLWAKCKKYVIAKEVQRAGMYPYFRALQSAQSTEVYVNGKKMLMLGSNNYLGLTDDPRVKQAAIAAIEKYGSGCAGSRFLNGNLELHQELELRLAEFLNKEAALLFSTGFQTNLGIIQALIGRRDIVVTDKLDHASIIDGCRLSFGKMFKFEHNQREDLDLILSRNLGAEGILIIVDGIFSMEGDIVDLPMITDSARKYRARVLVDDAHAIGVLGKNGRGTAEHFNLENKVDLVMGTFSKSLASLGGFVAGDEQVIHYIRHFARSLIFSAAIPPANAAAALKSLEIIQTEPERREKLWYNTRKMKLALTQMGYDTGTSNTPIIPIFIPDKEGVLTQLEIPDFKANANSELTEKDILGMIFWRMLQDAGLFVNIVLPPAVPPGKTLLRTSYTATHTEEQLNFALSIFEQVGKKIGFI